MYSWTVCRHFVIPPVVLLRCACAPQETKWYEYDEVFTDGGNIQFVPVENACDLCGVVAGGLGEVWADAVNKFDDDLGWRRVFLRSKAAKEGKAPQNFNSGSVFAQNQTGLRIFTQ
eukprot:2244083-Lingulodinium_polyedra.AAC.1